MFGCLGEDDLVAEFGGAAEALRKAVREVFVEGDMVFNYVDASGKGGRSQLAMSLAILLGVFEADQVAAARERLLTDASLTEVTLSTTFFRYRALLGGGERYMGAVLGDIERQWGAMLAAGCTTFWETIKGEADFEQAGSLCHAWSAVPVYVYLGMCWVCGLWGWDLSGLRCGLWQGG